ncbi:secoisolariciresinol dehydrogenase-like [Solanum pennellii]|uniref:Secoisolariciresinol dehydrogenase-like n=1 Tax=Solanum pennellii TaxID=28526 RepID=A0ABM1FPY3_SOLPN|nr:secoisolariciresinol dehydrogenase-like [Solanum pennellii]
MAKSTSSSPIAKTFSSFFLSLFFLFIIFSSSTATIQNNDRRLEGKVAIITGGASGIGAATARRFVRQGAKVVICDIQDNLGTSVAQQIGNTQTIIYVHCDVSIESDVQNVVNTTIAKFGKLDIMFSNAGVMGNPFTSIQDIDYNMIKKTFDVNVVGGFFCAKHAARVMIPKKKGVIIFTTSIVSTLYSDLTHIYTASKNALLGLTKNVGVELAKYGIRVNSVSPYAISTPLMLNAFRVNKEMGDKWFAEGANLKGVLLSVEDVANGVLYLASDESKYASGLNLILDGGYTTTNIALGEAYKRLFINKTM